MTIMKIRVESFIRPGEFIVPSISSREIVRESRAKLGRRDTHVACALIEVVDYDPEIAEEFITRMERYVSQRGDSHCEKWPFYKYSATGETEVIHHFEHAAVCSLRTPSVGTTMPHWNLPDNQALVVLCQRGGTVREVKNAIRTATDFTNRSFEIIKERLEMA